MLAKFSKIFILLLLLPAFLSIGVSEGLGLSWCFGDDGHVELATVNGCGDSAAELAANSHCEDNPELGSEAESCGPCLDYALEQDEAIFAKRLHKAPLALIDLLAPKPQTTNFATNSNTNGAVGRLARQPQPRISQTILLHRTTVLLT